MNLRRFAPYLPCDTCRTTMQGIRDHKARTTCSGCGGRPLISNGELYQRNLRSARVRLARSESLRVPPRDPDVPRAA